MVELVPEEAAKVKREPPETRQVGQVRLPVVASRDKGLEADTAIVPEALGMVRVRVVPLAIEESWKANFLVLSPSSWNKVVESVRVLLVKTCDSFKKAKVSEAVSAGMVAVRLADGASEEMVVVLVVPKTSWLVVADKVRALKVGVAPVWMFWGRDKVMEPAPLVTLT